MRRKIIEQLPEVLGVSGVVSLMAVCLGSGRNGVVLFVVLAATATFLGLDVGRGLRAVAFSVVALCVTTFALGSIRPGVAIPGYQVLVLVVVLSVLSYATDVLPGRTNNGGQFLIGPSAILWLTFRDILHPSQDGALRRLAGDYAEDNAAWLIGLGNSSRGGSSVLSSGSNAGGGPSTGSVLVLIRDAVSRVAPDRVLGLADNPRVLLTAFIVVSLASALLLAHSCEQASESQSTLFRHSIACLATAMFVPFSLSLMKVGHFSAAVAVLFFVIAVNGATTMVPMTTPEQTLRHSIAAGAALVAMGQAWYPLTGVAMLYVVLVGAHHSALWWRNCPPSHRLRRSVSAAIVAILIGSFVIERFFSTYLGNLLDLDYLRDNLRLAGGYAPVNPLLFVASTLVMLTTVSIPSHRGRLLAHVVHAITIPLIVLMCVSFLMSPNTPQYGVLKLITIVSSVLVPLSSVILVGLISARLSRLSSPVVSALAWCTMMFFAPPGNELKWISEPGKNSNDWATAIVREADSGRSVVCLNTEAASTARDYEAYLCTRLASSVTVDDTYETRTWTAANICQISPKQAGDAFTSEFQENLTVVIFDERRVSSGEGCQAPADDADRGWVSSIDWKKVKVVDVEGDPVIVDTEMLTVQEGR